MSFGKSILARIVGLALVWVCLALYAYCRKKKDLFNLKQGYRRFCKRKSLKNKILKHNIPSICAKHSKTHLSYGDMAVIDPTRCEVCASKRAKAVVNQ